MTNFKNNNLAKQYVILAFVVIIWGVSPLFTKFMYNYNSASINTAFAQFISVISLLIVCRKKLKLINKELIKTAGLTGFILGIANVVHKIGYQYTTPTNYAFLENLQVVAVPIIAMFFFKKKPTFLTIFSCVLCLFGCGVLCGIFNGNGFSIGMGDLLCSLGGIFYGINIAVTGAKVRKYDAGLYILIQLIVGTVIALITALVLNFIKVDGVALEPIKFTFRIEIILAIIAVVLISSTLCWILRTNAMKYVDATVVAIIMPLSAVITSVCSIIIGTETFSTNLLFGALLILIAVITSSLSDVFESKRARKLH